MREPRHTTNAVSAGPVRTGPRRGPMGPVWSVLRGVLEGALPIAILIGIVALFWEVMTIVRFVTVQSGFLVTQQIETVVAVGGVVVSLVVFLVAGIRTLRGVRDRQLMGDHIQSIVTMVIILVSLIWLANAVLSVIGMPQQPAP